MLKVAKGSYVGSSESAQPGMKQVPSSTLASTAKLRATEKVQPNKKPRQPPLSRCAIGS